MASTKRWFDTYTYEDLTGLTGYLRRTLERDVPLLPDLAALNSYIKERRAEIHALAKVLSVPFEGDELEQETRENARRFLVEAEMEAKRIREKAEDDAERTIRNADNLRKDAVKDAALIIKKAEAQYAASIVDRARTNEWIRIALANAKRALENS